MAKEKEVVEEAPVDPRQERWEAFLAQHAKQNPGKHAARLAAGELSRIPDDFQ